MADDVVVVSVTLLHVFLDTTLAPPSCRLCSMPVGRHVSCETDACKSRSTVVHLLVKNEGCWLRFRLEAFVAELDGVVYRIVGVWNGRHGDDAADVATNGGVDANDCHLVGLG